MVAMIQQLRRRGLWQVAVAYAVVCFTVLALTWGAVEVFGLSFLYVRLTAVFAFMGLPMAMGLAWALREPNDPDGKGFVVRD